jgi:hypothetical protein
MIHGGHGGKVRGSRAPGELYGLEYDEGDGCSYYDVFFWKDCFFSFYFEAFPILTGMESKS